MTKTFRTSITITTLPLGPCEQMKDSAVKTKATKQELNPDCIIMIGLTAVCETKQELNQKLKPGFFILVYSKKSHSMRKNQVTAL